MRMPVSGKRYEELEARCESLERQMQMMKIRCGGDRYKRLLGAVKRKFHGESRFETALRYISERELITSDLHKDEYKLNERMNGISIVKGCIESVEKI